MKTQLAIFCSAVMLALNLQAGVIYNGGNPEGATIPDGSPVGVAETATVSGYGAALTDITVTLNISGRLQRGFVCLFEL